MDNHHPGSWIPRVNILEYKKEKLPVSKDLA